MGMRHKWLLLKWNCLTSMDEVFYLDSCGQYCHFYFCWLPASNTYSTGQEVLPLGSDGVRVRLVQWKPKQARMGRWWERQATWLLTSHFWHLMALMVKSLPSMWGTEFQSLGWEDPLEKGLATHSSILAWGVSRTEEPGGPQCMGSQSWIRFQHLGFRSKSGWSQIRTHHLNVGLELSLCDLLWLRWVFTAVCRLFFLVAASGGYS